MLSDIYVLTSETSNTEVLVATLEQVSDRWGLSLMRACQC